MKTVWLYQESCGSWDDWTQTTIGVFTTKEKAEDIAARRPDFIGDGDEDRAGEEIRKHINEMPLDTVLGDI